MLYTLGDITIGANAVVSQKCYLCTGSHDFMSQHFDITASPIVIGENAGWQQMYLLHPVFLLAMAR